MLNKLRPQDRYVIIYHRQQDSVVKIRILTKKWSLLTKLETLYRDRGADHGRIILRCQCTYIQMQVVLCVGMISANGKVPAGSVTIPITHKGQLMSQQREQVKSIDKCADKLAKVTYKLKIDFIRSIKKQNADLTGKSASKFTPKINHSSSEYFFKQFQPLTGKSHSRVSKNISLYQKKQKTNFKDQKSTSRVGKSNSNREEDDSSKSNSKSKNQHFSAYDSKIAPFEESRVRVNLKPGSRQDPDTYLSASRVRIQSKYSTAVKGLSQEQLAKYKQQIQQLTSQLNLLRQKNKNLQRKQREQLQQIRQLRDQIQKLKTKLITADSTIMEHKFRIQEKDRIINKLEEQLKILKDYVEQIKVNSNMQEKKIDYRESAFAEQVKKINEKYQQSQSQKQKIMVQMNNMLTDYQTKEKKNLLQYKDKQRVLIEQKNKLMKKVESLTQTINSQSQSITELKSQIQELRLSQTSTNRQKQSVDLQMLELLNLYKNSTADLKKMENKCAELETELQVQNDVCHQLRIKQKKYEILCVQHAKLKQNEGKLITKVQSMTKIIKDLQQTLKQQSSQKQSSLSKTAQLTRQLQSNKKSLQSQQSQLQSLRSHNTKLQSKIQEQSQKYSTDVYLLQEQKKKMQGDIVYLMKSKENLMNQYQQIKWRVQKLEENQNNFRDKIAQQSQKILALSSETIDMQGKLKAQKQVTIELENSIQLLKSQILSRQSKQKQLNFQLKSKSQSEIQNIKTIRNREHQLHLAKQKQLQLINIGEEMKKKIQQLVKQIDNVKSNTAVDYDIINKQLQEAIDRKDQLLKEVDRLKEQCRYQKNGKAQVQRKVNELESQLANAIKTIKDMDNKIQQNGENQKKINTSIKRKEEQIRNIKQQLTKYKAGMCSLWQNFTTEYLKDATLETFTLSLTQKTSRSDVLDQSLISLLTKLFKFKLQLQAKHITLAENYEQLLQNHETQVTKLRQNIFSIEQHFQNQLKQEKMKQKQLYERSNTEKNDQLVMISTLEQKMHELLTQKERLALQLQSSKQDRDELSITIQKYATKQTQLEQNIHRLENDKKQQSKQIQYLKLNANSDIKQVNQQNKIILDKQKNIIKDLQKKLQKQDELLQEAEAKNKLLQDSLSQKTSQLNRIVKNLQSAEAQIQEYKLTLKQLKQQLGLKEKSINQYNTSKQIQNKQISDLKFKLQDLQLKNSKLAQQKSQLINQNKNYQQQIKDLNNVNNQSSTKYIKLLQNQQKNVEGQLKQIKQQNQKIISLNSDIELKQFMIQQLETSLAEIKLNNTKTIDELNLKKQEIKSLTATIDQHTSQNLVLQQNYQSLVIQKQALQQNESGYKEKVQALSIQSSQKSFIKNMLENERKQAQKIKSELAINISKVESLSNQLKVSTAEYKKEITVRTAREEQMKKKIRDFQKQVADKSYEGQMQMKRKIQAFDQERQQLIHQLELYEQENTRIKIVYENLRDKYQKDVERLNQECAELTGLLTEKQEILCSKDDKIAQKDGKIKLLTLELKQCLQTWETERRELENAKIGSTQQKADKIMSEVQARSKLLLNGMQRRIPQFSSTF